MRIFHIVFVTLFFLFSALTSNAQEHEGSFIAPAEMTDKQIAEFNKNWNRANELSAPYIFISGVKHEKADRRKLKKAIKLYQKGLKTVPDHWASYWSMGKAYQSLRNHNKAYEAFLHAYTLYPDNKDVLNEYMIEAMETSKFSEAVTLLEANQHRWPDDIGIRGNYAFALLLDGQTDKAIETLKAVEKQWPNDPITTVLSMALKIQSGKVPQPKTLTEFYAIK